MKNYKFRKNDKKLKAFVQDVAETLCKGDRYQASGFGTFSTCSRKATADRAACKMAMFRGSNELRDFASGGTLPTISGPHTDVIDIIIHAMLEPQGIDIPAFGRMAAISESGKKPKLIFHAAEEFNNLLS